jgi:hypothetical protein
MNLTPAYETDCKNLSPAALAKKYKLTYSSWKNMRQRCKREGIFLDQKFSTFAGFLAFMGPRTSAKYTCDRIDYDGPYSPGNCRWASKQQQSLNRRNAVKLTYGGETLPIIAWAARLKKPAAMLRRRKRLGWTDEEIITGNRAGARRASADWPWAADQEIWERKYKDHARKSESRERFYYRVCSERYTAMMQVMIRPLGNVEPEVVGINDETGEPIYKTEPLPPGFHEHLELVKRTLADAESKLKTAEERAADPFAELFRKL